MEGRVLGLDGVTVRRGKAELLSDVDWSVREGERWVVLGPNGAGKTTLLNVACSQLHPTQGQVEILGEEPGRVDVFELRPLIGYAGTSGAAQVEAGTLVIDLVVSAAYGYVG